MYILVRRCPLNNIWWKGYRQLFVFPRFLTFFNFMVYPSFFYLIKCTAYFCFVHRTSIPQNILLEEFRGQISKGWLTYNEQYREMLLGVLVFAADEHNPLSRIHSDPVPTAEQKKKACKHYERRGSKRGTLRSLLSFPCRRSSFIFEVALNECLHCDTGRRAKASLLTSVFDATLLTGSSKEKGERKGIGKVEGQFK